MSINNFIRHSPRPPNLLGKDLTIVLPTLNEEGNIASLIFSIKSTLPGASIVVVDDSSTDNTASEINKIKKTQNILLIERRGKRCLTDSIQDGIDHSQTKYVAWMDADHSHPPKVLFKLYQAAKLNQCCVIASRYKDTANFSNTTGSFFARTLSFILNFLIYQILKLNVTDYTSGFVVLPRSFFDNFRLRGDYGEYFIHFSYYVNQAMSIHEISFKSPPRTSGESKTGGNFFSLTYRGVKYLKITVFILINERFKKNI